MVADERRFYNQASKDFALQRDVPLNHPGRPSHVWIHDRGSALDAAEQALELNRALNDRRRAAGLPGLDVDLVLHFVRVVYGNVGTSRRLDFTVIGRAVNEASRIEELCDDAGRSILVSDTFAERCGRRLELVGTFALRGLERKQQIWAPLRSQ